LRSKTTYLVLVLSVGEPVSVVVGPKQSRHRVAPDRVEDLGKNRDSLGKPREIEARIKNQIR